MDLGVMESRQAHLMDPTDISPHVEGHFLEEGQSGVSEAQNSLVHCIKASLVQNNELKYE